MDIFSTQSLTSAKFNLSLFSYLGDSADSKYNVSALNASQAIIKRSLKVGSPAESGYLFSTLVVHNAMAPSGKDYSRRQDDGGGGDVGGDEGGNEGSNEGGNEGGADGPNFNPGSGFPPLNPFPLNNPVSSGGGGSPGSVNGGVTSSKIALVM